MRVVIDMQGAQTTGSRDRGIGRYSLALGRELCRQRGGREVVLVLNGMFPEAVDALRAAFADLVPDEAISVWDGAGPVRARDASGASRRRAAELSREAFLGSLRPDIVLDTSIIEGFADDAVTSIGRFPGRWPTAAVLYDLIPLIHRDLYLADPVVEGWYLEKLGHLRRADLLLSISESSGRAAVDLLGFPPGNVVNISTACDRRFRPVPVDDAARARLRDAHGLRRPFLLYTGGIDHRKNIERLVRAYAAIPATLRAAHQLAVVCAVQPAERLRLAQLGRDAGLEDGELALTGYVPDDDLVLLYNACKLFVFPSWHEGFGLPALEAMACGRAVIGSDTSSIPEVIGRADALFDPRDEAAITRKLVETLTDDGLRAELERYGLERAKAFSWDATARRAWQALEGFLPGRAPAAGRRVPVAAASRPRLAYLSPLPPARSGIADYSAELLPHLARHYDIEVVVAQDERPDDSVVANHPVRDVGWFRANGRSFDRVLYHVGNSPFHGHMFRLMRDIPGVVVLHDFFLSHVVRALDRPGGNPHGWPRALLHAHGWPAVRARFDSRDGADALWGFPCNLEVLQHAQGVIVHSEHSCRLARTWYGPGAADDWAVIPLLRVPAAEPDRVAARRALGAGEDEFRVCSFGMLGPAKLNHRLLSAWLASPLAQDPRCRLVFVGEGHAGDYGAGFAAAVRASGLQDRISVTGWVDPAAFRSHLAAADVAVQLRTDSRGETSSAVLDCMNHALATIVNAHGALAALPDDAVARLPDDFSGAELAGALAALWRDADRRRALGRRAAEWIRAEHQPHRCAEQYAEAIERGRAGMAAGLPGVVGAIAKIEPPLRARDSLHVAHSLANDFPPRPRRRQVFLDVSILAQHDARSGIQRTVRALVRQLLLDPPAGWAVEPVLATADERGFRYARRFTCRFLDMPDDWAEDEPIDAWPGDVFVGLDLQHIVVASQKDYLLALRRRGIRVWFVVYDLLPVLLPQVFAEHVHAMHQSWLETISHFDGAVCISRAVATELADWQRTHAPHRLRPFRVESFHLGADIENSVPTLGLRDDVDHVLRALTRRPAFLMVGTIEPRKCQAQALAALELLWGEGLDANLVIVGNEGWMAESLMERLRRHPELGRRLFWLEGISDEYLGRVYAASSCLICASLGEGFGLPLIEAAQHRLPIMARDIPVFREVAGEHAFYFSGLEPRALADAIREWVELYRQGRIPRSDDLPWLTWKQSAEQLTQVLLGDPGGPSGPLA